MENKPEIIFTFPHVMGGVASFNRNIINNSQLLRRFKSKVILLKSTDDHRPQFAEIFNTDETIVFEYSPKENQYYVQDRLNKIIGESPGCLVTDNYLSLAACARFRNQKTVYHIIHDYFYVNQNVEAGDLADVAIAHSSFFSDAVFAANPFAFNRRHFYIPYGVDCLDTFPEKNNSQLKLVFLGRLDEAKGAIQLFEINKKLLDQSVSVAWTVIGQGALKASLHHQWRLEKNISFLEPKSTKEIYCILASQDIFVFPTLFEGTPVSILECLANGVVTITHDLPGGIRDIVKPNIGYRCEVNDSQCMAKRIIELNRDRSLLRQMQVGCFQLANSSYNIRGNADKYFEKFLQFRTLRRANKKTLLRRSFLDRKVFPNRLVFFLRKLKSL